MLLKDRKIIENKIGIVFHDVSIPFCIFLCPDFSEFSLSHLVVTTFCEFIVHCYVLNVSSLIYYNVIYFISGSSISAFPCPPSVEKKLFIVNSLMQENIWQCCNPITFPSDPKFPKHTSDSLAFKTIFALKSPQK